jgi:translation initiation factor IF-2
VVAGRTRCRGAVASVKPAYPRQAATAAAPAAPRPAAATWPARAPPSAMRHSSISGLLPPALAAPQRAYARSDRRRGGPGGAAGVPDGAASAPARRPTGRPGGSRPAPRRSGTPSCRPRRPARARQTGPGVAVVGAVDLGHRGVQPLDGRGGHRAPGTARWPPPPAGHGRCRRWCGPRTRRRSGRPLVPSRTGRSKAAA